MATRWARFARGWVVAGFATFVAALSHTLAGGTGPGGLAVVLSLAFGGIVCVGLAGRTLSLWRVSVSVLVSQLIFHGLFSMGAPGGSLAAGSATSVATAGTHPHAAAVTVLTETSVLAETSAGAVHVGADHGAGMWLAHAVAAVVTIAALRYGEAAFWGLLASAALFIRALLEPVADAVRPVSPQRTPTTAPVFTPRDLGVLLSARRLRGPPVLLRVA